MKFKTDMDAKRFLLEIGLTEGAEEATKELKPTDEMVGLLKKSRGALSDRIRSFRRSQSSKGVWRKNRADIMRGIKAFHRSTEGKRFHKNLSRFLVRKDFTGFLTGRKLSTNEEMNFFEKAEVIKSISSAKTHLFIELEYYQPLYEEIALEDFVLNYAGYLSEMEQKILHDQELCETSLDILLSITESSALIKSLASQSGKEPKEVEGIWKKIKKSLIDQGRSEDDENFYAILVGSIKNALKIK